MVLILLIVISCAHQPIQPSWNFFPMVTSRETGSFLRVLLARDTSLGGTNGMSVLLYVSLD